MINNKSIRVLAVIFAIVTIAANAAGQAGGTATDQAAVGGEIRAYVREVAKLLPTSPGIAVAVVKGDKIIFIEGFGKRDIEKDLPVTSDTAFYIASTTKSFTGTAAKILADRGTIDLDAPIRKYFPNLSLPAPVSADQLSIRDLLTHRSGLSNDAIAIRTAYIGHTSNEDVLRLLSTYSKVSEPTYEYTNLGYIITGIAIENVTGKSWKQVLKEELFSPLGLSRTTTSVTEATASNDFAVPYESVGGKIRELPLKADDTMHAAGGIFSSAKDLAQWLIVNMNGGRLDGKQVIDRRAIREVLSPQIDQKRRFYEFERYAYGLGWNLGTFGGDDFVHCFGTYAGARPHVSFMPEKGIGVVVLVNESSESLFLPDLIAADIYDRLNREKELSTGPGSRTEKLSAELEKMRERTRSRPAPETPASGPTYSLQGLTGTFENEEFGEASISLDRDRNVLVMSMGNLHSDLVFTGGTGFRADFRLLSPVGVSFDGETPDSFTVVGRKFSRRGNR